MPLYIYATGGELRLNSTFALHFTVDVQLPRGRERVGGRPRHDVANVLPVVELELLGLGERAQLLVGGRHAEPDLEGRLSVMLENGTRQGLVEDRIRVRQEVGLGRPQVEDLHGQTNGEVTQVIGSNPGGVIHVSRGFEEAILLKRDHFNT